MTYFLSLNLLYSSLIFLVVGVAGVLLIKPWKISPEKSSKFIDEQIDEAEYSSGLFLAKESNLSLVAQLQQTKIEQKLKDRIKQINPPTKIKQSVIVLFAFLLIGFLGYTFNIQDYFINTTNKENPKEVVSFQPLDSISNCIHSS